MQTEHDGLLGGPTPFARTMLRCRRRASSSHSFPGR